MRQLGKGQSVVFCVPEEIQHRIQALSTKSTESWISVADVLAWSISETWLDAKRCMALWAVQGKRYQRQQKVWTSHRDQGGHTLSEEDADQFLEPEAQTLREKYGPTADPSGSAHSDTAAEEMDEIDMRSREFITEGHEASLQQEAERELSPEAEEEKSVERPPPVDPLEHVLHTNVLTFVESGEVLLQSEAYMPAFESLSHTSAALRQGCYAPGCRSLYVTADFAKTVVTPRRSDLLDSFQRPVQWILSRKVQDSAGIAVDFMMIISSFEAQYLVQIIGSSKRVALHLYAPRPNLGFQPLDSMDLFVVPDLGHLQIPQALITRLNIFAG